MLSRQHMRQLRLHLFVCAAVLVGGAILSEAQGITGVFFDEGWESGTVTGSFNSQNYGSAAGSQFQVQGTVRAAGSWAFQHLLPRGLEPSAIQYATQHIGDARAGPVYAVGAGQHFFDLYVQYKVYYSPGFDIANVPKQLIIGTEDDRRHDNACCNPWVAHYMTIFPPFGNRAWNAEANNKQAATGQWVGFLQNASGYGPANIFAIQPGSWHTVEVRRRLNDSGVDNGIFQMWVDGTLISDHRSVRYRVPWDGTYGSNLGYGTNFVMISDYMVSASTRDQSIYYDDIKFSPTYIGTASSTTPPAPPSNVRVIR